MKISKPNNPSHAHSLTRLNRVSGQLGGVKRMIQERRYCPDILIQLKAIRSAVRTLEAEVLATHLEHCVNSNLLKGSRESKINKIDELKEVLKTFT